MEVILSRAKNEKELKTVQNFFLDYFYTMSQYDPQIIINSYGLPMWSPFGLPGPTTSQECIRFNWWIRDICLQYVIMADGQPAGFVIICADQAHLAPGVDYELMDFYITPKYRRQKIGRLAARAAFDLFQGRWQVFQLEQNPPARTFWQSVVGEYTNGNYENLDGGTQQRFQN